MKLPLTSSLFNVCHISDTLANVGFLELQKQATTFWTDGISIHLLNSFVVDNDCPEVCIDGRNNHLQF